MKRTKVIKPQRKIFIVSLSLALLILVASGIWALTGGTNWNNVTDKINESLNTLTETNLVIKTDKTRLAANGLSQTKITAQYPKAIGDITAEVTAGSGTIQKQNQVESAAIFTYTSGTVPGSVEITFKANTITERLYLELHDPTAPTAPQILSPTAGSSTNILKPEIIGTGPANTRIIISNNGQPNTSTTTDSKGAFKVRLERALTDGEQTLTAVSINDLDIGSPNSNSVTISVKTEPLTYDRNNIRVSPSPVVANQSFGIFIPVSLNTEKVQIEFQDTTYELTDFNGSSIYSKTLPAPTNPGSYSANLLLIDAADGVTRFDGAIQITVVDHN